MTPDRITVRKPGLPPGSCQSEKGHRAGRWIVLACAVGLAAFMGLSDLAHAKGSGHPRNNGRHSGGHKVRSGSHTRSGGHYRSGKAYRSGGQYRSGRRHRSNAYYGSGRHYRPNGYYGSGGHYRSGRHPRSGHTYRTARHGYYGGYYGGHYGYSRHYGIGVQFGYRHYGYPYYGYPYYGYYGGWPYGYAPPYAPAVVVVPALAAIDLEIKPDKAEVWMDGDLIGIADDFDGYPDVMSLPPGEHTIVLKHPGYKDLTLRYDLKAGESLRVRRRMVRESPTGP